MATNISFPTYGFVNEILALSEDNWRTFFKPFITDSVQSGLATIAGANMTVYVSAGECRCGAVMGILDEMIALDVANGDSTYDRIDSVIVQYTYGEPSTLAVAIVQGTPSTNPVPPTLTKVYDTLWQMEIAQILVPSGATSSSEFTITDKRVIYESIESIIDDNTESEERVWSSQKSREEIVSLSTEIYDSLNTKADVIERTVSGDIVTITNGGDNLPVKELVVDIDPVQDLHGYDNPWPAGGGKNLLMPEIEWQGNNGITWTINADSSVTLSGTFINNTWSYQQQSIKPIEELGNVGDTVSFGTDIYIALEFLDSNSTRISIQATAGMVNVTIPEGTVYYRITIYPTNTITNIAGTTINKNTHYWLYKGPSDASTTWTPYSNICPISGHTSAVVTRTGINIWDEEWELGTFDSNGQPSSSSTSIRCKNFIAVKPGQTYYMFSGSNKSNAPWMYGENKSFIRRSSAYYANQTFTIPSDVYYIKIALPATYGTTYNHDISINYPSSNHNYHQGNVQTVTIDLDGTRYGGSLNFLTGEMTVDRAMVDLGTLSWKHFSPSGQIIYDYFKTTISGMKYYSANILAPYKCSQYKTTTATQLGKAGFDKCIAQSGTIVFIADSAYTDASVFKTAMNGVQLVYELAEPFTVQLDASTLETLKGENHFFADTGDVAVEYRADSKLFIDEQIAESQIKTRQMMTVVTDQMIAPNNLSTNDIVVVNDELYKATANIASGEEMTVGTNVIKITLAEYIQSLL